MLFNTIEYLLFLPIVVIFYFLLPHKLRWILLLAASYFFYMSWKVEYVFLIAISTLIAYSSGVLMEKYPGKKSKLLLLILNLSANLGYFFSSNTLTLLLKISTSSLIS